MQRFTLFLDSYRMSAFNSNAQNLYRMHPKYTKLRVVTDILLSDSCYFRYLDTTDIDQLVQHNRDQHGLNEWQEALIRELWSVYESSNATPATE